MEEMDHETSVNVDVEEPTTSVNVYGSPVAAHGQRIGRINILRCPFGERESSGKLNPTFCT